jgi:Ca-activated chloride channel family protein
MRYFHAHSGKAIGHREIQVTPVKAQILAPASVAVAAKFAVKWQGPAYATDLITIALPSQKPDSYYAIAYVKNGKPIRLRAPADPDTCEVHYILFQGAKMLTKVPITVRA